MDIYTIIFLALAVFIFLRLRSVLGQRTGNERPPYDRPARNVVQGGQDNVVPMSGSAIDQAPLAPTADVTAPTDRWKGITESGTPLAQGLDTIVAQDSSFDPRHFISGARSAYEMIVVAPARNIGPGQWRILAAADLQRQVERWIGHLPGCRLGSAMGGMFCAHGIRVLWRKRQRDSDHGKRSGNSPGAAPVSERFRCQPTSSLDRVRMCRGRRSRHR